jgi:hypothetical protein
VNSKLAVTKDCANRCAVSWLTGRADTVTAKAKANNESIVFFIVLGI